MDPHTLIPILTGIGVKYIVNILNWWEDVSKSDLPNLGKQAVVVVLAYIATKIPQIQPYLPQVQAWVQVGLVAVIATLSHHVIDLLVALQKKLGG